MLWVPQMYSIFSFLTSNLSLFSLSFLCEYSHIHISKHYLFCGMLWRVGEKKSIFCFYLCIISAGSPTVLLAILCPSVSSFPSLPCPFSSLSWNYHVDLPYSRSTSTGAAKGELKDFAVFVITAPCPGTA